jgi:hexulose-6-phosphate isomerase
MQGRLTEPNGRGIQFFPFDNWEQEFQTASEIGLDEIEFIFDYNNYADNPLWTDNGIERLLEIINETGVKVNAVCFDYFMRRPFFKSSEEYETIKKENTEILLHVIKAMERLDIGLIEIPLVDDSSLKNETEKDEFREWLIEQINKMPQSIKVGLETDLPPHEFLAYLDSFGNKRVGANYDSGNSSGIGYNLYEEVTTLKNHIFNIHIKDRVYHGKTVQLGTGSADFEKLFKGLNEIKYRHNFILQAARGEDGSEAQNIRHQIDFVKSYIHKYNI